MESVLVKESLKKLKPYGFGEPYGLKGNKNV